MQSYNVTKPESILFSFMGRRYFLQSSLLVNIVVFEKVCFSKSYPYPESFRDTQGGLSDIQKLRSPPVGGRGVQTGLFQQPPKRF